MHVQQNAPTIIFKMITLLIWNVLALTSVAAFVQLFDSHIILTDIQFNSPFHRSLIQQHSIQFSID